MVERREVTLRGVQNCGGKVWACSLPRAAGLFRRASGSGWMGVWSLPMGLRENVAGAKGPLRSLAGEGSRRRPPRGGGPRLLGLVRER